MSGGVDSSVAAYLMQQKKFDCVGAMMLLYQDRRHEPQSDCDAQRIAQRLGIPFHTLDAQALFRRCVIDPFVASYESGETPNPCIECNRHLKFGYLLEQAQLLGCDIIATGHYAQVQYDETRGRYLLYKAVDHKKDQSYFLACLTQEQLAHVAFPLGSLTKDQVRQIAAEMDFLNARRKDSQDVCFIPDGDYRAFLKQHTGKVYPCGMYLDLSGKPVGTHNGAVGYTIGQRKGLGLAMGEPVYVCGKDMLKNTVTVGPDSALYKTELTAKHWNWISCPPPDSQIRAWARIRYRHQEQPALVTPVGNGTYRITFDQPQRAITPGQTVVLYDGDMVIGSGLITP